MIFVRSAPLFLALGTFALCQSPNDSPGIILSNRDARIAASSVEEATVPPGFNVAEFSVRISVDIEGAVTNVSNPNSLPDELFAAAATAARKWRFFSNDEGHSRRGFSADIAFHGPISGSVVAKDGTPIADVTVVGSQWMCCPVQEDAMKTGNDGAFHIEHPGEVLHFLPDGSFQPQLLVVTSGMSTLKVVLDKASSGLALSRCESPQSGFERISWGNYGLQFDAPRREVDIKRGKTDVDYVVHSVKAKHSNDYLEFWFGFYAITSTPPDKTLIKSDRFSTRYVAMLPAVQGKESGTAGIDSSGHTPDGKLWRHMGVFSGGAIYEGISPENAALFDRIIDSACWIPYPENQ